MSDGPHRSLKMRRGWKQLAERADNRAFTPEEIADVVIPALTQDWRADVTEPFAARFCEIMGDSQDSLFPEKKLAQLDGLRRAAAGHELANLLIDCGAQLVSNGRSEPDASAQAAANALNIWAARRARQVEEHYWRQATRVRAHNVRTGIEEGIGKADVSGLARQLVGLNPLPTPLRAPLRQTGLDDGVQI